MNNSSCDTVPPHPSCENLHSYALGSSFVATRPCISCTPIKRCNYYLQVSIAVNNSSCDTVPQHPSCENLHSYALGSSFVATQPCISCTPIKRCNYYLQVSIAVNNSSCDTVPQHPSCENLHSYALGSSFVATRPCISCTPIKQCNYYLQVSIAVNNSSCDTVPQHPSCENLHSYALGSSFVATRPCISCTPIKQCNYYLQVSIAVNNSSCDTVPQHPSCENLHSYALGSSFVATRPCISCTPIKQCNYYLQVSIAVNNSSCDTVPQHPSCENLHSYALGSSFVATRPCISCIPIKRCNYYLQVSIAVNILIVAVTRPEDYYVKFFAFDVNYYQLLKNYSHDMTHKTF